MSGSPAGTKKKAGGSIYDRLTDSSQYTGAHKERFDSSGHGRGKEGRVDEVKITGHTQGSACEKKVQAESPSAARKASASPSGSPAAAKKKEGGGGGGIFDKLTDSSQYTGAHKERFDSSGHGVGLEKDKVFVAEQAAQSEAPEPAPAAPAKAKAASPAAARKASASPSGSPAAAKKKEGGGGGIFDKLTDSSQYTGAHKERFDSSGQGRGKDGRVDSKRDTGYVQGFANAKHLV